MAPGLPSELSCQDLMTAIAQPQNALQTVARFRSHQSPDTVGDWLPNSGLSPEAQAKIIDSLK